MKKERSILTMDGQGNIALPTDTANIWMSEFELGGTVRGYSPDSPCWNKGCLQKWSSERIRNQTLPVFVERLRFGCLQP